MLIVIFLVVKIVVGLEKNILMKTNTLTKLFFGLTTLIALNLMTSCGNGDTRKSFWEPKEYNDYIVDELHRVDRFYSDGMKSMKDSVSGHQFCVELEKETQKALDHLNIQPFEGDSSFCEVTKELIKHYNQIATKELPEFINIIYSKNRSTADQGKIDEISSRIDGETSRIWSKIGPVQQKFAANFNLHLNTLTH